MSGNSILNTDLNVSGVTTSTRFIGNLEEIYIDPGIDGQLLTTALGATAWVNEIQANNIPDNSISTAKIVDLNVTEAKLATDSVTTTKIADNNVTPAKIEEGLDGQVLTTVGTAVTWADPTAGALPQTTVVDVPDFVSANNASITLVGSFILNQIGVAFNGTTVIDTFPVGFYRFTFTGNVAIGNTVTVGIRDSTVLFDEARVLNSGGLGVNISVSFVLDSYINNPTSIDYFMFNEQGANNFTNMKIFITRLTDS